MSDLLIFSGRVSLPLAEKISQGFNNKLSPLEIKNFADGEIWLKYNTNLRGKTVFIIQSTNPPADNLMELLIALDAAKRASAKQVIAVIPYFGYARQDRKDQPRVSITAKLIANLLTKAGADKVIALDLHANQIQGFFDIPFDNLFASSILIPYWRKLEIPNLAIVAPDMGASKSASYWAKKLHADLIVIDKRREQHNQSHIINIIGNPNGKNLLIVDDIIDTAGTFAGAVEALVKAGAGDIYASFVHPVLSNLAYDKLKRITDQNWIKKITVTDSIPLPQNFINISSLEIISVAPLLAEAIRRVYNNESISSLFDQEEMKK